MEYLIRTSTSLDRESAEIENDFPQKDFENESRLQFQIATQVNKSLCSYFASQQQMPQ
jgi:hypothetical protein